MASNVDRDKAQFYPSDLEIGVGGPLDDLFEKNSVVHLDLSRHGQTGVGARSATLD